VESPDDRRSVGSTVRGILDVAQIDRVDLSSIEIRANHLSHQSHFVGPSPPMA